MTKREHSGPAHERPRRGPVKLPQLSWYVLGQILGPVALLTLLMTCVILLTQSLRLLDLVINRGQSAPTFVYLTLLILPGLLVIILPIAYFFGTIFTLSRLNGDSELVVMASAGYSQRQLAPARLRRRGAGDAAHLGERALADAGRAARAQCQSAGHPRRYRRGAAQ